MGSRDSSLRRSRYGRISRLRGASSEASGSSMSNTSGWASKARPIAITLPERTRIYPDVPALAETYPGFVSTGMLAMAVSKAVPEDIKQKILGVIPLGRFGSVNDIAAMVDFLASEEGGYITGQVFSVDGGMAI